MSILKLCRHSKADAKEIESFESKQAFYATAQDCNLDGCVVVMPKEPKSAVCASKRLLKTGCMWKMTSLHAYLHTHTDTRAYSQNAYLFRLKNSLFIC